MFFVNYYYYYNTHTHTYKELENRTYYRRPYMESIRTKATAWVHSDGYMKFISWEKHLIKCFELLDRNCLAAEGHFMPQPDNLMDVRCADLEADEVIGSRCAG